VTCTDRIQVLSATCTSFPMTDVVKWLNNKTSIITYKLEPFRHDIRQCE